MTIKEIAKLAGVSPSTVSRIINNKAHNINIDTKNRVLQIVKEYNYTPYGSVLNTSTAKTFLIGVILRSCQHRHGLTAGILETLQHKGYSLLIYDSQDDPEQELKNINLLCHQHVDGVLWEPVDIPDQKKIGYFQDRELPLLYLNHPAETTGFQINLHNTGYKAAEVLLQAGHHNVACLTGPDDASSEQILDGFINCLSDHKIPYSDQQHLQAASIDYHNDIIVPGYTGIISSHYAPARVLHQKLERLRYQIPQDLSLIAITHTDESHYNDPPVSCMHVPYRLFGNQIAEQIVRLCETGAAIDTEFHINPTIDQSVTITAPAVSPAGKILVIGSMNIDITMNVEEFPQSGKTIRPVNSLVITGGKAPNQACGIVKLGGKASVIGKVGNDHGASLVYDTLQEYDIDISSIYRDPDAETGKAYIHVKSNGESIVSLIAGANNNLTTTEIRNQKSLFKHTDFCLLQTEIPLDIVKEAALIAKASGCRTILKPVDLLFPDAELLKHTDIIIPSQAEAEILCPEAGSLEARADFFLRKGPEAVIITRGAQGCYVKTREYEKYYPAQPFTLVDNTGASDAFICALVVFLSEGYSMDKAVRIATYAAGFCISRQGVIPALIDRNSLEIYIRSKEKDLI